MSSIVHKVKDAITPNKTSAPEGSHGPHTSRVGNAADPRIDSDRDGRAAHTTTTGAHDGTYPSSDNYTYGSNTTGAHGSSGVREGVAGPHSSRAANAADPRVDSDLDRSRNMGVNPSGTSTTGTHTTGAHTTGTGLTGSSGLNNHSTTHGTGPVHNSNAANKLDPRVKTSSTNTTGTTGTTGMTGAHSTTTGTYNSSLPEGTTGPHSSRLANSADPRVDSDADRSRNMGMNRTTGTTGMTSTHGTHGTTGLTGSSGLNNHSTTTGTTGMTGTHGTHGTTGFNNTTNPGPAPSTAGPHKSDMMNKLDVQVDSDLDGSKTLGRDKTYSRHTNTDGMMHKDPTDAAQVPPSVLQKHVGPPTAAHTRREGHHGL